LTASVTELPGALDDAALGSGRKARRVRVVSARNTGDHAWKAWLDRHRQRLDGCTSQQPCASTLSVHVSRSDGVTSASVDPGPAAGKASCLPRSAVVDCIRDLVKDHIPPPDVCSDPTDCRAEVLLALE
jgi:hypothetical protein